jgi:hypothetical protein
VHPKDKNPGDHDGHSACEDQQRIHARRNVGGWVGVGIGS